MYAKPVSWLIYPATMGLCLALYAGLRSAGMSLPWAMYLPAFLGAGLISFFEWCLPHRRIWRPDRSTLANDLAYMTLVQMMLPAMMTIVFVLVFVEPVRHFGLPLNTLWPHAWPIWVQAILMLLAADFLRYWLHRASHRYSPLWRLHAVHHAPGQLYWLNVGRFHPVEKTLQMIFDTLPFMILGVGVDVIALYFVFYAVNGFFQHCNIQLRFGWLNWIVSSAELHRWHHARLPEESDHNFGNNLIVWDVLFGTRYLPRNRSSDDLGLPNPHYPQDFLTQLRTPFIDSINKHPILLPPFAPKLKRWALRLLMAFYGWRSWRPLRRLTRQPETAQIHTLRAILARNGNSRFGREHHFDSIADVAQFRTQVPVHQYDDLRPYIEAQMSGQAALTDEQPVLYALTSGTTGTPKFIPVLRDTLRQHRNGQRLFTWLQYSACPQAFDGPALGIVGSAIEDHTSQGIPIGSVSGTLYASMPAFMRSRYVAPPEVFSLTDYDLKYRTLAQLALRHAGLTYIAGANPSSFLRLQAIFNDHRESLIDGIKHGYFENAAQFSPELTRALAACTLPLPGRASALDAISRPLTFANVWPNLRMLATWTSGSCGIALTRLRAQLPPACAVFDIGYVSTEFRGTLTLEPGSAAGLPLLDQHYYEFVEQNAWDTGQPVFRGLHELIAGRPYYVIVTTASGLYRYFMNDLIVVESYLAATPLLRFVQKGRGVTSITGEKLYEGQLIDAVKSLETRCHPVFYLLLAEELENHYQLYLEPEESCDAAALANQLDQALAQRNIEYRDKRASGRLHALTVTLLRTGTGDAYKQYGLAQGQREGQFKYLALQYRRDCAFDFKEWALK